MSDILNVVQRWESLGLLEGLPVWEKEELAQVYDNATRLLLSEQALKKIPKDVFEIFDNVYIPICRRLYRRVGTSFDIENMMSLLLNEVSSKKNSELIFNPKNPEKNPIVEFCIIFADTYEDGETNRKTLSKEDYEEKIDKLLSTLRSVLLDDEMVSFINREDDWKIVHSEAKKTVHQTRFWNQKIGSQLVNSVLSDINKGLN
jgi:hypothetical protein